MYAKKISSIGNIVSLPIIGDELKKSKHELIHISLIVIGRVFLTRKEKRGLVHSHILDTRFDNHEQVQIALAVTDTNTGYAIIGCLPDHEYR